MGDAIAWVQSEYKEPFLRRRMPMYMMIQSLAYERGMGHNDYFNLGKKLNILYAVLCLFFIWLIFRHQFSFPVAINMFLAVAFQFYLFKSPYFQVEVLHFFFFFLVYLLSIKLLLNREYKWALLLGLVMAISFLLKATLVFYIYMMVLYSLILSLGHWLRRSKRSFSKSTFVCFLLSLVVFSIVASPYLWHNLKTFGTPFYTVSQFDFWCDSTTEFKDTFEGYNISEKYPDLPPGKMPGPGKYFSEHSFFDFVNRFIEGFKKLYLGLGLSFGLHKIILLSLVFMATGLLLNFRAIMEKVIRHTSVFLFMLGFHLGYAFLIAWYMQLDRGLRHISILILPLLFTSALCLPRWRSLTGRKYLLFLFLNAIVFSWLCLDIHDVLTHRIYVHTGGR